MSEHSTTSVEQAEAARDEALDRVAKGAGSEWVDHALDMIRVVARSRQEFTSDDVWTVLERRSVRVACHRRPVAVWSSCVYVGGET